MELQDITLPAEYLSADAGKDPATLSETWLSFLVEEKILKKNTIWSKGGQTITCFWSIFISHLEQIHIFLPIFVWN